MKTIFLVMTCILFCLICSFFCPEETNEKYIFFLHNRFLELHQLEDSHPDYGRVEYLEIIEKFSEAGFKVISEKRKGNINAREYAYNVTKQIDSLIALGINPKSITVIGTSKGGYIAQYVSTMAKNPALNFIFIASHVDQDLKNIPEINYCGNILSIYDKNDEYGTSAFARYKNSTCETGQFKEIELNTGLQHGFVFKALDEWLIPSIQWANGNHHLIQNNKTIYQSKNLKISRLGDNLFVHESYLKQYNNVACNGMIYTHNGQAIIFDTPTDDVASLELIKWITGELNHKIKAIVVNHFHIDCLGGLAEFHKIQVPSYSSNATIRLARSEIAHSDFAPQIGFQDSLFLKIGDSYIENRFFGAGHSSDNIVSYIKDEKALFGGCLVKSFGANKGSLIDADVNEWSQTVRKIKDYFSNDLKYVVPGHGSPGGTELLDYTIELFKE